MEIRLTLDLSGRLEAAIDRLCSALTSGTGLQSARPAVTEPAPQEPTPEPAGETAPEAEAPRPAEKTANLYPDDEEMRQHMDICISKFAGNGWKDSKDKRTLAIKRGCTSAFKEIAKWLGADKPTALEGEKRLEFVKRLGEILIEEGKEGVPSVEFRPF